MTRIFVVFITMLLTSQNTYAFHETKALSTPFEVPRSDTHRIKSLLLGRTYDIFIKVPSEYSRPENANKKYPVIYLNDGPYTFLVASGVTHIRKMDKAILVGISFAKGENGMASRVRDLTPMVDKSWVKYETGGANQYLKFIETEVISFVENNYRADPTRRTLAGQSLGGSFGAWVLLTKPQLFSTYILTSPSLWFKDDMIFDLEKRYAETNDDLKAKVFFATGEYETPLYRMENDMVSDIKRFTQRLKSRKYPNLILHDEIVSGAIHETTFPIGFAKGLLWIYKDSIKGTNKMK